MNAKFEILEKKFGKISTLELVNKTTNEYVTLIPQYGGLLHQVCLIHNHTLHNLLWSSQTYDDFIERDLTWYNGAMLSPFPDRIKDGRYTFENIIYNLEKNEPGKKNALHGFLIGEPFIINNKEANKDFVSVTLEHHYEGNKDGYPFPFILFNKYTLNNEGVTICTVIKNIGTSAMPYGQGWHPYFCIDNASKDFLIKVEANYVHLVDENLIPTGEKISDTKFKGFVPLNYRNIKNKNMFFYCFELDRKQTITKTVLRNKIKNLDIIIWQQNLEKQYKFLQLFTIDGIGGIAIEPLTCIPNGFNNQIGLLTLKPTESISMKFGIKLKKDV